MYNTDSYRKVKQIVFRRILPRFKIRQHSYQPLCTYCRQRKQRPHALSRAQLHCSLCDRPGSPRRPCIAKNEEQIELCRAVAALKREIDVESGARPTVPSCRHRLDPPPAARSPCFRAHLLAQQITHALSATSSPSRA
jgi:hypothetical protein